MALQYFVRSIFFPSCAPLFTEFFLSVCIDVMVFTESVLVIVLYILYATAMWVTDLQFFQSNVSFSMDA